MLKQYKLKQWQLAKHLGVAQSTLIRWQNNGFKPEQMLIVVKGLNDLIEEKLLSEEGKKNAEHKQ